MQGVTLNSLKADDLFHQPYTYIKKQNFLTDETITLLDEAWPEKSFIEDLDVVMGGRRTFENRSDVGLESFRRLCDLHPVWADFYRLADSERFVSELLNLLAPFARENGCKVDLEKLVYKASTPESRRDFDEDTVFLDFEICEARKGYIREPHHDNWDKLMVMLLYMNELPSDAGGEFIIYGHKEQKDYEDYERYPDEKDVEIFEKVAPKRNLLLGTLNSKNSYHGVGEIVNADCCRRFLYFALTVPANKELWGRQSVGRKPKKGFLNRLGLR